MATCRIVVTEDYEPFRRFVRSILDLRPEWQIISEVSDGREAVQKAEVLKPDLILMDIGLPGLNGMEAARRIRKLSPKTKILFVTLETSPDALQEALNSGAVGYVVKKDAGRDLAAAVEAACSGRRFISSSLSDHVPTNSTNVSLPQTGIQNAWPIGQKVPRSHEAHFYSGDTQFIAGFTRFIAAALEAGSATLVVATESHRMALLKTLRDCGSSEIAGAIQEGRYIALDVAETLATFMVDGVPDALRFQEFAEAQIRAAVRAAKGPHHRVAACGEAVSILWEQGNPAAAIQLERLWNQLAQGVDMDILCGYALIAGCKPGNDIYDQVCAEHSAIALS